jgi:DNA-binding XRE family transcriptional regulator
MSMTGVGAYIRTLREKQGITRAWLAEQVDTSDTSLYRIENGQQQPGLELMLGIIQHVRGSVGDIRHLLRDENAREDEGRQLAEIRLSESQLALIDNHIDEIGQNAAQALADRLMNDPAFRQSIVRAAADSLGRRRR